METMILEAKTSKEITRSVERIFSACTAALPKEKKAKIFIKINANSDMIGLTGNTTDLRLVTAVIFALKRRGFKNIFVGDGPSSGFINTKIDCLRRLSLYRMGECLQVGILDLNKEKGEEITVLHNYHLKVARICFEADFFINLPKLKTHGETQMSACLKNMIGCVVGIDKQIVHRDLPGNILELNRFLMPNLHIMDAILPMEGLGPSRGIPKNLGLILAGTDGLILDLAACKIMGRKEEEVPYLALAKKKGLITTRVQKELKSLTLAKYVSRFSYPNPNSLQRLINHPFYRLFFVKIRYAPAFFQLFSSGLISKPMYWLGIRQDLFLKSEAKIKSIKVNNKNLTDNERLNNYCPMGLNVRNEVNSLKCIGCLYCYFVDREKALSLKGRPNHLSYQINKYKHLIEKIAF